MKTDSRSILVVDDNLSLRETLGAILESSGYEVVQASEGSAAIALARQNTFALLITDLLMEGQEGMETIRIFVKEFPHTPVIAISGSPDYLPIAKVLGAAAVLTKPIGHAQLLETVRGLIG